MNESENMTGRRAERYAAWGRYALLTLAIIAIIFLLSSQRRETDVTRSRAMTRLMSGDYYLKVSYLSDYIKSGSVGRSLAAGAIQQFENRALQEYRIASKQPIPAAIRRYAVLSNHLEDTNALDQLERLTSPQVRKSIDSTVRVQDLQAELEMWRNIYGNNSNLSRDRVREYESRIKELNMGPTKPMALNRLYLAAGDNTAAARALSQARQKYGISLISLFAIMVLAILAAFIGVWVIGYFLGYRRKIFQEAEKKAALCRNIQYPVLWSSFLGYMIAFVVLGILMSLIIAPVIENLPASESLLYALGAQLVASVVSGLVGLGILVYLTKQMGGDLCDIGITTRDFWKNVGWGFLGYAGLLPVILLMAVISSLIFGQSGSGDHPIIPMLLAGGWLSKFAILVLASVLAPIFEEVFFRGVLYNALRARLSVAMATVVSAFAFAIVHPQLPAGFLPIFGIGVVFAILFETRRSLVPSMVAHSLNNTLMLMFTILAFGD